MVEVRSTKGVLDDLVPQRNEDDRLASDPNHLIPRVRQRAVQRRGLGCGAR